MKIIIDANARYSDEFIKWLVETIRDNIFLGVNSKRLPVMSQVFNELSDDNVELSDYFEDIVKSIDFIKAESCYHIGVNQVAMARGTKYKLIDLAKFIDYGNSSVNGERIFSRVFSEVSENVEQYYQLYLMSEGVL